MTKEQVMIEYVRCMKDTPYALKTYLQTYDNTVSKYVPLELFPDQISLLDDYENYNENIALKYRQAGVSTVTAAWVSKRLAFAKKNKPEKILIIANKLDTSLEMANKIRAFVGQWPSWVGIDFSADKNSQKHYKQYIYIIMLIYKDKHDNIPYLKDSFILLKILFQTLVHCRGGRNNTYERHDTKSNNCYGNTSS